MFVLRNIKYKTFIALQSAADNTSNPTSRNLLHHIPPLSIDDAKSVRTLRSPALAPHYMSQKYNKINIPPQFRQIYNLTSNQTAGADSYSP